MIMRELFFINVNDLQVRLELPNRDSQTLFIFFIGNYEWNLMSFYFKFALSKFHDNVNNIFQPTYKLFNYLLI